MKKVKLVSIIMAILLLLLALSACSGGAKWSDENVIFSYDKDGNPIITFPDNFEYPESYYDDVGIEGYAPADFKAYDFYKDIQKVANSDSLYLIKVISKISPYDYPEIRDHYERYSDILPQYVRHHYYEVVLVYDFLRKEEVNETFIMYFMNWGYFKVDTVPYQSGDCFISFIANPYNESNPLVSSLIFIPLFVELTSTITMDTSLYTENNNIDALDDWGGDKVYKNIPFIREGYFRRSFYQELKLGDFLEFLQFHLDEVGYTPSEKSALYDKNTENE